MHQPSCHSRVMCSPISNSHRGSMQARSHPTPGRRSPRSGGDRAPQRSPDGCCIPRDDSYRGGHTPQSRVDRRRIQVLLRRPRHSPADCREHGHNRGIAWSHAKMGIEVLAFAESGVRWVQSSPARRTTTRNSCSPTRTTLPSYCTPRARRLGRRWCHSATETSCNRRPTFATTLELAPRDRCLNVMPLFHIHGLVAALLGSLSAGASVVCTPGFSAVPFLRWIDTHAPTWYTAVPTMHQAILARLASDVHPVTSLRFIRLSSDRYRHLSCRRSRTGSVSR